MIDGVLEPQAADEGKRFVEPGRAVFARDAERLLLGGVHHAEAEAREQPATG